MKKRRDGCQPKAGALKIELVRSGPDEGKYTVSIGSKKLEGAYSMEEVMALISEKERTAK